MSMPAFSCIARTRRTASRLPSASAAPSSFHGAESFSGSASHEGFGRLPAMVVGSRGSMASALSAVLHQPAVDERDRLVHVGGAAALLGADGLHEAIDPLDVGS